MPSLAASAASSVSSSGGRSSMRLMASLLYFHSTRSRGRTCPSLVQELLPPQQIRHDGPPRPDRVVRVGHSRALRVRIARPAVITLLPLDSLLFLRVLDDAREQLEGPLHFGTIDRVVAAKNHFVQVSDG